MRTRVRVSAVLCTAMLLGLLGFVAWTEGVPLYQRAQQVAAVSGTEALALPAQVYDPSPYVPSTSDVGPPGPVGLVFQGRLAYEGFTGKVPDPWYAVSARTGAYRRLEAPHLQHVQGRLALSPDGTQVAWAWPGGIDRYDTVTGDVRTYPVDAVAGSAALVWSPDSTRLAFGRDPVRALDMRTGDVTVLPLVAESASVPAWTPDGLWVAVVSGDTVEAVEVGSGRHMTFPVERRAGDPGGFRGADWNASGELAGVHRQQRFGRNVLRILRMPPLEPAGVASAEGVRVRDASPDQLSIQGFLGWGSGDEAVLTGLRAVSGPIEQAVVLTVPGRTVSPYMQFPTLGDNWAGVSTVSVAADLLGAPSEDFEQPTRPWSPGAKLLLCLLLALFPAVYYVLARRPRA
ncbi:MAG: WD40 repeat domain-containing protein [Actinomycetota bacterium]|nr:WD40 repeat domain-containing protein [Actinomycetota bacterium]